MAFTITDAALRASEQIGKTPILVLKIEGVDVITSSEVAEGTVVYGSGHVYGESGLVYGGSEEVPNQQVLITYDGSSTSIQQQLQPDKPGISSVSSMQIALVDKDLAVTRLISPGEIVDDVLGRRCKIYLGFQGTSYPEDYIVVFRGIIDDIKSEAGKVVLNIAHPDQKKRQDLFIKAEDTLASGINNSVTTIPLVDSTDFLQKALGPDGAYDSSISFYVRIDDEIIKYDAISGNNLTGATRAQLGTTAASHSSGASVQSIVRLTGNAMHLALKLMLSGWNDYFVEDVAVGAFNQVSPTENVPNAIFFADVDLETEYGLTAGDYLTTSGASNGANNVTLKTIESVVQTDLGSYAVVNGVSFVDEATTSAVVKFRSQYDTLGVGMKLYPDEVDVPEHLRIYDLFLSSFEYDFYLKDTINGKDFLEQELYFPAGSYPIPRKSQASVGFHSGPIPGANIQTLSSANIKSPSKIAIRRTTGKNFYNTIIYKFDESALEDEFNGGVVSVDVDSKARIPVGTKALNIESKGMRTTMQAVSLAENMAQRRLNRYKYAAEFFEKVEVFYKDGYRVEIGDNVILNGDGLFISDTKNATRDFESRFFEVVNKVIDFKTGNIILSLLDTSFSTQARYGLISPASFVKNGSSSTVFIIEESFAGHAFGADEFRKWDRYLNPVVRVRSADFSTISPAVAIHTIAGNTITVASSLGFTPTAGMIMELAKYDDSTEQIKLIYGFMSDGSNDFADGGAPYRML